MVLDAAATSGVCLPRGHRAGPASFLLHHHVVECEPSVAIWQHASFAGTWWGNSVPFGSELNGYLVHGNEERVQVRLLGAEEGQPSGNLVHGT